MKIPLRFGYILVGLVTIVNMLIVYFIFLVISDPDDALTVMNSCLRKNRFLYKLGEPCCGNGLILADGNVS